MLTEESTRVEINIYCQTLNGIDYPITSTRVEINIYCQTLHYIRMGFDLRE